MVTKRKILVPIDFNERSLQMAIPYAAEWAKRYYMEIDLLHVIEESGVFSKIFSNDDNDKLKEDIRLKLIEIAEKTEKEYGIRVNALVTQGRVTNKINEVAELVHSAIIIMPSGNTYEVDGETAIGANTHRIVRVTDSPVLIIRHPNYPKNLKKILVPMDLSTNSRSKIPEVINLAKKSDAKVVLVYGCCSEDDLIFEKKLQIIINQSFDAIKEHDIDCEVFRMDNHASSKECVANIAAYAGENQMDLIMVVGRAESVTDYYIDYTAQDLIRLSPIPVLCITTKNSGISFVGRI